MLHKPDPQNPVARYVNYVLTALIVANALFVALETVPELWAAYGPAFHAFEAASTLVFAVEYAARLWVCTEQEHLARPVAGRLRYALQPLPLLDFIVVATYWLPVDLRFLRVARMVRLLKVLRLDGLDASLTAIGRGLQRRAPLIAMAVTMMLVCIYASAALVFQLEHAAQPQVFTSIPATFWWALETLTTIGYGDMAPVTPLGKLCVGLIAVFGIGIFALPTAIVTAVILEAGSQPAAPAHCPHCGKPPHD